MYPSKYKPLLKALREGNQISFREIINYFLAIREEIETNRYRAGITTNDETDVVRLDYNLAREIVAKSVEHHGFIEIGDDLHDSIDDCADVLIELDEVERLAQVQASADVW